ncbi:hypothetical protein FK220_009350 [Flavobacteriaceae bacterium TP-CH-4]|uniref:Peptidase M56 domain-containing protein n=1 Tax=Pelagihabitans pacificus TaxID=2696054 RepID=A0A967AUS3_9FLAO|nr:ankyrin repeat domain-containing protein [Pelagihabitans pacificus]NHF59545.1 hypothetical protein [Pelagihabitans pacificus]
MVSLLIKASLVIIILWVFYKLLLEKESFFKANRMYLVAGLFCAFLLPFIALPELISNQGIIGNVLEDVGVDATNTLKDTDILGSLESTDVAGNESMDASSTRIERIASGTKGPFFWISLIYVFGVSVLSLRLIGQFLTLFRRIRKEADQVVDGNAIIINGEGPSGPCSFFNYIFIDPGKYSLDTYEQVLQHEKVHVQKRHSLDLLLAELVIIFLWFNPFAWFYRKEIEKNIEYQTDDYLLKAKTVESEKYQINLLEIATQQKPLTIVSSYNHSLIKKRIVMMNTKKSNRNNYFKYAFIAPVLFATVLFMNQPFLLGAQESQTSYTDDAEYNWDGEEYQNNHSENQTPLMRAAADGALGTVKILIANGVDVNEMLYGEGTALYRALQHSNSEIAGLLLESGADPNLGSTSDGYPIMAAIASGDEEMVRLLIKRGADVNRSFPGDGNAMIQAARYGFLGIMKILVEAGADVNKGVKGDGNPLIMAAKGGQLHIVKYLIGLGADINAEVIDDETPLINASEQGHLSVVKYLVENGADINQSSTDTSGRYRSPLKMAKKKKHTEITKYLKSKGAKE